MILRALLSHYRRHPVQALFLLTGIVMANVLLAGTQLINAQARSSYASGEQLLRSGPVGEIRARDASQPVNERTYIELRRRGHYQLVPALRRLVSTGDGARVELLGIDLLAMPRSGTARVAEASGNAANAGFSGFAFPPYQLWGAPARLAQLGWAEGERVILESGALLPPVQPVPGEQLGHRLLIDIGALQSLTGDAGSLSALLVFDAGPGRLEALRAALPEELQFFAADQAPDPARLTRSFHLNLAAMGLLSFVVGVFLMYNALAFSYTERRELIRRLRLAGVARGELLRGLLAELALFLVAGTLLGVWLGALLAARLLPGVGQTLAQLYGVYIAYPDGLAPDGLWLPLLMTLLAAGLCLAVPLRQSLTAPLLRRRSTGWALRMAARRDVHMSLAGLALLAAALVLGMTATGTRVALAGMACLLLGAALCLPLVLRALLSLAARWLPGRDARGSWLVADSRWLLGPASLALMAMTLALVANSGLNIMIDSFRQATDTWLMQRLDAGLYLRKGPEIGRFQDWLDQAHPGLRVEERHRMNIERRNPAGRPVRLEVRDLPESPGWLGRAGMLRAGAEAATGFADGAGILVSERAWRLDGWDIGHRVQVCPAAGSLPVLGIYHDYGNPLSQWIIPRDVFRACWPGQGLAGQALYGPGATDWAAIAPAVMAEFGLGEGDLVDQDALRQVGLAVFDRTFAVTRALNTLTLLVAGIGIFCAVSAIHHHRAGLQALLASLGLSRRERGVLLLSQWGLLGLLCMVLVWPFGTALAAYLAGVVTPVAFGWSFALVLGWPHYLALAALAAGSLVLAVLLPSLRLLRTPPAMLLRDQPG